MKPLNCKATDKCQIDISEMTGYKELLRNIKEIISNYERKTGRLLGRRKSKKLKNKK